MPYREEILSQLLKNEFGTGTFIKPSYSDFSKSIMHDEIKSVYCKLNGQLEYYPVSFRGFDIQLKDCIVELDEEQHFNRYRALTLESRIYRTNYSFSTFEYEKFCKLYEGECLKKANNRKYWKTDSTERQFGKSSPEGILTGGGSSRWRQRAFNDFLRDIGQQISNYRLIRISIHQIINDKTIGEILNNNLDKYFPGLLKLVERQI